MDGHTAPHTEAIDTFRLTAGEMSLRELEQNNSDRFVNEVVKPCIWILPCLVWRISNTIWTQITPFLSAQPDNV